jgi:hypothetical protein
VSGRWTFPPPASSRATAARPRGKEAAGAPALARRSFAVEISDPAYTEDLIAFLERCDCTVEIVATGLLDVAPRELPIDASLRQPELEVEAYVGIWSALRSATAKVRPLPAAPDAVGRHSA